MVDDLFDISGEVRIEHRGMSGFFFVGFGERDAFRDGTARRNRSMDHRHGQFAAFAFDHHFGTSTHPRQHVSKVAGGFRLRDVDHMVGHAAIISLFPLFLGFHAERRQQRGLLLIVIVVTCRSSGRFLQLRRVRHGVHLLQHANRHLRVNLRAR